jgi:hypothetical protein
MCDSTIYVYAEEIILWISDGELMLGGYNFYANNPQIPPEIRFRSPHMTIPWTPHKSKLIPTTPIHTETSILVVNLDSSVFSKFKDNIAKCESSQWLVSTGSDSLCCFICLAVFSCCWKRRPTSSSAVDATLLSYSLLGVCNTCHVYAYYGFWI